MDMHPLQGKRSVDSPRPYTFSSGMGVESETHEVSPDHYGEAAVIDSDNNFFLTDAEIRDHLMNREILRDPDKMDVDEQKVIDDFKITLQSKPLPQMNAYHSYDEMTGELKSLSERYPGLCQLTSLGKTHEGREIWALRISGDSSEGNDSSAGGGEVESLAKPELVITGLTHAREWATLEVTLHAAKTMAENYDSDPAMKKRIDGAVTWFVPCVNPDGLEHSRSKDTWWRKNRNDFSGDKAQSMDAPLDYQIAGEAGEKGKWGSYEKVGVDINRNFWDGNPDHLNMYRLPGDSPGSTSDDKGASDSVTRETYRGPGPASEKETQALVNFELENKNIKAVLDFHSYGNMILYPWSHTNAQTPDAARYKELGNSLQKVIREADNQQVNFRLLPGSQLYLATGTSFDIHQANGILGITLEIGRSFQPSEKEVGELKQRMLGAQMHMVDYVIEHALELRP